MGSLDRYLNYYGTSLTAEATLSPEECRVVPWFRTGGDKKFRYSYKLSKSSIAYDMGGYEGEWAEKIYKKYGCQVEVFEPVERFVKILDAKFKNNPAIHVHPVGLAGSNRTEKINLEMASSSTFKKGKKTEAIKLVKASEFIPKDQKIALMKINIEGGEYDLLDNLIKTGLIKNIDNLQIQFHVFVPNARKQRQKLQAQLAKTHQLTYNYPFIWENWSRK